MVSEKFKLFKNLQDSHLETSEWSSMGGGVQQHVMYRQAILCDMRRINYRMMNFLCDFCSVIANRLSHRLNMEVKARRIRRLVWLYWKIWCTGGLPTKDETSETIVRNLYCLFPFIHDYQESVNLFVFCRIIK